MRRRTDRTIFLRGRKVILRPPRKATDLEKCLKWVNDPEVGQYVLRYLPIGDGEESEWFDNLSKRRDDVVLAIETLDGVLIGTMGLHRISSKDGVATSGAMIGEKRYWGRGYGTDAKMLLLNYAFNVLNLRKVCSEAYAFNARSLAYNRHCGYRTEGVRKRQVWKQVKKGNRWLPGAFYDVVLLAVFKEDWLPIWERYQKTGKIK